MNLLSAFPTYRDLEAAPVALVAGNMLRILAAKTRRGEASFHVYNEIVTVRSQYDNRWECARAVSEAISWLTASGLICQSPDQLAGVILTREGVRAADSTDLTVWIAEREFPEALLHPIIVRECLANFRMGKYDTAVFEAFKNLEILIRETAGLATSDIGVSLARKAFRPVDGILTDRSAEAGEQQALADLMSGSIGSYKNPHSHRKEMVSVQEAREMLLLATHLLRIVESRGDAGGRGSANPLRS